MAETQFLTKKNEIVEIKVIGGGDTVSAGKLGKTISDHYHNTPKIILDFVDVPYISRNISVMQAKQCALPTGR